MLVGRRAGLTTAAAGICLVVAGVGPAIAVGAALAAAPDPIGYSPAKDVVAVAPLAVSITFGQPLRSSGASLRVIAATGVDVGKGPIRTSHRTLRRDLQLGAPGGDYTIRWAAVSAGGHQMSGAFSFTAARSNMTLPSGPTVQATAVASAAPSAVASSSSTATPSPTVSSSPTPTHSPTAALITASRPTWVAHAAGPAHPGSASRLKSHSSARGFTAIPLAVAGLLVLSAALVARLKRRVQTY